MESPQPNSSYSKRHNAQFSPLALPEPAEQVEGADDVAETQVPISEEAISKQSNAANLDSPTCRLAPPSSPTIFYGDNVINDTNDPNGFYREAHEKLTGTQPRSSTEPSPRKAGRKCKQLPKSQRAQPKPRMSLEQDRDLMLGSRHGTPLGYKPFNPSIRHHSQSRDGQPGPESIHSREEDYDAMDSPVGTLVGGKAQSHLYGPQKHGAAYENGGYMWDEYPNGPQRGNDFVSNKRTYNKERDYDMCYQPQPPSFIHRPQQDNKETPFARFAENTRLSHFNSRRRNLCDEDYTDDSYEIGEPDTPPFGFEPARQHERVRQTSAAARDNDDIEQEPLYPAKRVRRANENPADNRVGDSRDTPRHERPFNNHPDFHSRNPTPQSSLTDDGEDEEEEEPSMFHNFGKRLRPSRFAGDPSINSWHTNQDPVLVDRASIKEASLLKRHLNPDASKDKVCPRGYGSNDPENIRIVNLKDSKKLSFQEIADTLNDTRTKEGRVPSLTVCAVTSRYNRTAPILYASEGKVFVPMSKRGGRNRANPDIPTGNISWTPELSSTLVSMNKEYEANRWKAVAEMFNEMTRENIDEKQAAAHFASL